MTKDTTMPIEEKEFFPDDSALCDSCGYAKWRHKNPDFSCRRFVLESAIMPESSTNANESQPLPRLMGERITVTVTYRVLAGRAYTILEDDDGNRYLKLETFNPPQIMEPHIWTE